MSADVLRYWLCLMAMDKAVAGPLWQQQVHWALHLQFADACISRTTITSALQHAPVAPAQRDGSAGA